MSSSRLAIGQALVALLAAMTNPTTGLPLFGPAAGATKLGAIFDPTPFTTWSEVIHLHGRSQHAGSGGNVIGWRVEDEIVFRITCGAGPYELDSTAAQEAMLTVQDVVLPSLHSHYQLPQASAPSLPIQSVFSVLEDQPDRSQPVRFPDGHIWLLWSLDVSVKQQYGILLATP